ncbi:tyrosine-type recombinase/integrase [Vagococcus sp. BWB3-3]|uniref:Tyrosine-type recombinase/integrase n=1 Tax=Vagococcus allomyrinae TaxID=2794353 RepID=A0A940P3Q7_9ENTE|nr:site-specific integrase [Vagococcus allomyrinae]MBP1040969.1 tyrosine-type recombinase/integrase [Vagococcus allomyrinae]
MTKNQRIETMLLIQHVKKEMQELGYKESSIAVYLPCWNQFLTYQQERDHLFFSCTMATQFLKDIYGIYLDQIPDGYNKIRLRSIQLLCEYHTHRLILVRQQSSKLSVLTTESQNLLNEFKVYQQLHHFISNSSLKSYTRYLTPFFRFLENQLVTVDTLTPGHIFEYTKTYLSFSASTVYNSSGSLRVFLRFLFHQKYVSEDLSLHVLTASYSRQSKLPSTFSQSELTQLLASIDTQTAIGKRDYAIILIASRLGLRSGDIRLLTFSSLNWRENCIEITMEKTKKELVLPLTAEIGEALIDYIKFGRPKSACKEIFLTSYGPYTVLSPSAMSGIVKKQCRKVGIDSSINDHTKSKSLHSLRSTLATTLLENNVSLPIIADILGHSDTRTTELYLKKDIEGLRQCALNVPGIFQIRKEAF